MKKILLLAFLIPFIIIGQTPSDEDNISTTEDCMCGDINNDELFNMIDLEMSSKFEEMSSILTKMLTKCYEMSSNVDIVKVDEIS